MQTQIQHYINQIPTHFHTSLFNVAYLCSQLLPWLCAITTITLPLFTVTTAVTATQTAAHTISFYLTSAVVDSSSDVSFTELQNTYHIGCSCQSVGSVVYYLMLLAIATTSASVALSSVRIFDKLDAFNTQQLLFMPPQQQQLLPQHEQHQQRNLQNDVVPYCIQREMQLCAASAVLFVLSSLMYSSSCRDAVLNSGDSVSSSNSSSGGYSFMLCSCVFLAAAIGNIVYQRRANVDFQLDNNGNSDSSNNSSHGPGEDSFQHNQTATYMPPRNNNNSSNTMDNSFVESNSNSLVPVSQYTMQQSPQQQSMFPPFGSSGSSNNNAV